MIRSMTAFAGRRGALGTMSWAWEMRGVNGRGLDLRLRLPEGFGGLDAALRKAAGAALGRGSVTISLRLTREEAAGETALDEARLDGVIAALTRIEARAMEAGLSLAPTTPADVLAAKGVLRQDSGEADTEALSAALAEDFGPLLSEFTEMRSKEGAALAEVITAQLDRIAVLTEDASQAADDRRLEQREALTEALRRVVEDVAEIDEARVAQELALIAVKQDVTEEIDRLRGHVDAARALLTGPQPAGRKLDFLAQEFNREANTLCSKAQNAALTAIGLDLKAVIDQMREQIQNVE